MYQFSGKLKIFSIALILIGALGIGYSFYDGSSKTLDDAKHAIEAKNNPGHHGGHGDNAHADKKEHHKADKHETKETHADHTKKDDHHTKEGDHKKKDAHVTKHGHGEGHDNAHAEHVLHQMHNKPWSAFYVALIFFLGISLLVLAFYAAQRVAQSGWSVVLFRVMEAITANLVPASIIMIVVIILTGMHMNHLFSWMGEGVFDEASPNYDPIVDGKSLWLNVPGWMIRGILYIVGWNVYRWFIRKNSIAEDTATTIKIYKRNYNASVIFLVFFMVTESMAAWDWIMGLDPHWFSTLFGWYVLATLLVSAVTIIAMVTIYLRSKGYLPKVNDSHIHDLAKFMFGFSVFWTYLWFAQFMLIWYSNIPEEGTYFLMRFNEYKLPFLSLVVINFIFPVLLLINSDFKSKSWFVIIGGLIILVGHYLDLFVMIMPGTVGDQWSFGIGEISSLLFFAGIMIFATFSAFAKADPVAKGNPFLKESEHFHYYNIEHEGEDNHH